MSRSSSSGQKALTKALGVIQTLNEILNAQLQLVSDENSEGGDMVSHALGDVLSARSKNGHAICDQLLPAFERMQMKDIMQQQLMHVQKTIARVNRAIAEIQEALASGSTIPDFDVLLDEVYETYVMQQQREVHNRILGIEFSVVDEASTLDFF